MPKLRTILYSLLIGSLAACASGPVPDMRRADDPTVPQISRHTATPTATTTIGVSGVRPGQAARVPQIQRNYPSQVESMALNLPESMRPETAEPARTTTAPVVATSAAATPPPAAVPPVPTPATPTTADAGRPAAQPLPSRTASNAPTATMPGAAAPLSPPGDSELGPQPQIRRGTGEVINTRVAAAPAPSLGSAGSGSAVFNFEGESLQAVVKAILGDMLGQNYVIAPNVQGTVTLGTPKPVSPAEALNLLEMVLSWNNARMVYSGGRYNIVPADSALDGSVSPRTGPATNARGYEVRVVPLRYISATEMKKVLEPYARPNAIVGLDSTRNLITLAGTRTELENYLRTVQIFDVDWLAGMSVGVFPLQSGRANRVVEDLEKVFGNSSGTPSAGMFRFMPLEGANAVLVITSQESYLDQIQQWLDQIDSAGGGARLFTYELKYIKARELAERLAEVFSAGRSDGGSSASLAPGAQATQINSDGLDSQSNSNNLSSLSDSSTTTSMGSSADAGGLGSGSLQLGRAQSGNASVTLEVDGGRVGVSAVEETNSLLVRATPQSWRSIREVIEQLDVMPSQVHIEAQVVEVDLNGKLEYGVSWFFDNAVSDPTSSGGAGIGQTRNSWGSLAGSIASNKGLSWTFLGRDAAAIITALDEVTNVNVLQTPSIFVRNNAEATLNVGNRIPISSVSVNTSGSSDTTYSTVQYIDTGIILKVRPRITRDGMVFLDIVQEVSTPMDNTSDSNGNLQINTRRMRTEAAVQEGSTVMLAGLIQDSRSRGSSGVPGLSRIPIIGGLFGKRTNNNKRSEMIILLTPTLVRNPQEAENLTDEYGRRFRALEPIYRERDEAARRQQMSNPQGAAAPPVR